MSDTVVGRWGKSLAVRLPGKLAAQIGIREGERVVVEAQGGDIVIRRSAPRYTVEELFRGKSPQEWRELYRGAFDWGPDVGREIIQE